MCWVCDQYREEVEADLEEEPEEEVEVREEP